MASNNNLGKILSFFVVVIVIVLAIALFIHFRNPTGLAVADQQNNVSSGSTIENSAVLYFYDNKTSCALNGEIYVDGKYLGNSSGGNFTLNSNDYNKYFSGNSTLDIVGLTDSCFAGNSNLPFNVSWYVYDLSYYINSNSIVSFPVNYFNPRSPNTIDLMKDFVRPNEVLPFIDGFQLGSNDVSNNIDKIMLTMKNRVHYLTDLSSFRVMDYWQTPAQTLKNGFGDCEDWSTTALSLIKAKYSDARCYNVVLSTHITIFCYIDGNYYMYDQGNTKVSAKFSNDETTSYYQKIKLRSWLDRYFEDYGLNPNQGKVLGEFDDKQSISFSGNEDFINWILDTTT